jgi:hypothetical protein
VQKLSKGDAIIVIAIAAVIATAIYGATRDDWMPFCYLILIICLILFLYNIYSLLEDYLEKYLPTKPKISCPTNGKIKVEIICTWYLFGNGPIYLDVNGIKIGKTYRNKTASVFLPEGMNNISAYRDKKEMIIEEGNIKNGVTLMIWSENNIPPKYHVTFLEEGEVFNDTEIINSYKKLRKNINFLTYEIIPFGIIGLASMIWAIVFFFD